MFTRSKTHVEEGDLVLAWLSRDSIIPLKITRDARFDNKFGSYPHNLLLGKPYGSQIQSLNGRGFIHILHPSPELWSLSLPHRTQIVYSPDASYITGELGIGPGSRVIEAGCGSASLTHSLSRTVGETGRIWSYEYHLLRFLAAKKELEDHGLLPNIVTLTHRDVCKHGFEIKEINSDVNAVFLDLPAPWDAIPHVKSVANTQEMVRICTFSPCLEQVQRTIQILQLEQWSNIQLVEIAYRNWESRKVELRDLNSSIERLRKIKRKRRNEGKEEKIERGTGVLKEVSRMEQNVKNHTSYLCFAALLPQVEMEVVDITVQEDG
ncbi:tRNA (adenine(58)-N(1))-methyltransferase catalytic subunit TRM61 [Neolecta irregularis DAH-3]|uniref:tRNA (adenine(58)-N(1))-methyltransferase catalytic subunit TRM61 n=1 Tax=Neolecta irregularis (strain DAH-3) TaxID=1198029 RepID=A0A1U7LUF6_NEOID|nr:tRNA (adenine(58)-N(1))-methyltransferase catalytic subunit TRM61 [Neolecta irregularis DAH-3]|eukprot:OLL26213.1 tRNA (adenine(58)-N(1))-methyltransferase catalytic subunit TRM61 [Neolecta irregularis DAH-3]